MQMVCAVDALDDSPNEIFTERGGVGASLGPAAGNKVMADVALNEGSGCFIFFNARFCKDVKRRDTHTRTGTAGGDHLLQDGEEFRAAVGADAEVLRYASRLQRDALGAAPGRLATLLDIKTRGTNNFNNVTAAARDDDLMDAIGGKAAGQFGGALVTKQLTTAPGVR